MDRISEDIVYIFGLGWCSFLSSAPQAADCLHLAIFIVKVTFIYARVLSRYLFGYWTSAAEFFRYRSVCTAALCLTLPSVCVMSDIALCLRCVWCRRIFCISLCFLLIIDSLVDLQLIGRVQPSAQWWNSNSGSKLVDTRHEGKAKIYGINQLFLTIRRHNL